MDRRIFFAITTGALIRPFTVEAQPPGTVTRIGILTVARTGDQQVEKNFEALRQGLRERGWIVGQTLAFEYRWADGRYERLPDLAAGLVRLKVNAIVGATTPLIEAVKNATETIPIIMVAIFDPVGARFVASLAHPGGNITGLTYLPGPGFVGKQLDLVKQAVPAASRVAILMNPANPGHGALVREAEAAAGTLKVQVQPFGATGPDDLGTAFAAMARQHLDALLVLADAGFYTHRSLIVDLATKSRLPSIYGFREPVIAGGLLAYGPSIPHQWNRAAYFVDRILKGTRPADLPVEQPTTFELVINLETAKALGLTIPPSLLLRADQVIE